MSEFNPVSNIQASFNVSGSIMQGLSSIPESNLEEGF